MSERNEEAIKFFERVNDLFPKKENGDIAVNELGVNFFNALDDSIESQYIRDRIPESYVGEKLVHPSLCKYYFRDQIKEGKTPESIMLSQIQNGDFKDIGELDYLADSFENYRKIVTKVLRNYVDYDCGVKKSTDALRILWRKNMLLPENMREDVERYYDAYLRIFNNSGSYSFNDGTSCTYGVLQNLVDGKTTLRDLNVGCSVSYDEIEFACKVCKYYSFIFDSVLGWAPSDIGNLERKKSDIDKKDTETTELMHKLGGINEKLNKYQTDGFFRKVISRIRGYNPTKEEADGTKLMNRIRTNLSMLSSDKNDVQTVEDCNEIAKNYTEGLNQIIREIIVPQIKEESAKYGEKEQFDKYTDFFFSDEVIGGNVKNPLLVVDDLLTCSYEELQEKGRQTTCDRKIGKIMSTVAATPSAFLRFEELEPKTLESTLKIIREELGKIPVEGKESPLSTNYRNSSTKISTRFYYYTCPPANIEKDLYYEGLDFEKLMKTENLEEYIKGVGKICSLFITTFPYDDGNGKTLRCLANILLAHRGIIIPSLYESMSEKAKMLYDFDQQILNNANYDSRTSLISEEYNNAFLETVRSVGFDLTGQNRLKTINEQEKVQEDELKPTQP